MVHLFFKYRPEETRFNFIYSKWGVSILLEQFVRRHDEDDSTAMIIKCSGVRRAEGGSLW